jgi:hypothetical protein
MRLAVAAGLLAVMGLVGTAARGPVAAGEEGWIDLTPGKDLEGWKRVIIPPDKKLADKDPWKMAAAGKTLLCDGTPDIKEMLQYEKVFGDGTFHVEWRFRKVEGDPEYNSGIYVRTAGDARHWLQAQVAATKKPPHYADLFFDKDGDGKPDGVIRGTGAEHVKAPGLWNAYDITCRGKNVTVQVNGEAATSWDACPFPKGHVALQAEFFFIEFRNLRFKPS